MQTDKTTLRELAVLNQDDDNSLFNLLNFTKTIRGREQLWIDFTHPPAGLQAIVEKQQALRYIGTKLKNWPEVINNGTIMVVERFYEVQVDRIPAAAGPLGNITYKLFSTHDHSFVTYSVVHLAAFVKGMQAFVQLLDHKDAPPMVTAYVERIKTTLAHDKLSDISKLDIEKIKPEKALALGNFFRYRFKQHMQELISIYGRLDSWYSMAYAVNALQLNYPEFLADEAPHISARQLRHPMLPSPVANDIELSRHKNFLFLTGANMGGKSTFIRAIGVAVFMAHLGMAVPCEAMRLSHFDGILSNINVADNISRGESFFYNEVQRVKTTVEKITSAKHWLVLIDELFKGTNVEDAMKCSTEVVNGLAKVQDSIFVLSTHLYEIAGGLEVHPNIVFKYFETYFANNELQFSYRLKDGVSNDRLGYHILEREGVVRMLRAL